MWCLGRSKGDPKQMRGSKMLWLVMICLLEGIVPSARGDLQGDIQQLDGQPGIPVHSRKRRYVVFPEGSTLTVAACISPTALSGTGAIFTTGLAWAISYDLPNETIHTKDNRYEFPFAVRRHKRDLYVRLEKLMDSAGISGRSCVMKTICEAAQLLVPRQGILEEILRLLFTYPQTVTRQRDWRAGIHYVKAHQAGASNEKCDDLFPCPISLLELGLGFGRYPQVL